jgi:hypothetical protein
MDVQQRIAVQDGNHTPTECPPFAVALALVLLPLADDPRIDADAGIVQKNAPVDFTDIDPKHLPGDDGGGRCFYVSTLNDLVRSGIHRWASDFVTFLAWSVTLPARSR